MAPNAGGLSVVDAVMRAGVVVDPYWPAQVSDHNVASLFPERVPAGWLAAMNNAPSANVACGDRGVLLLAVTMRPERTRSAGGTDGWRAGDGDHPSRREAVAADQEPGWWGIGRGRQPRRERVMRFRFMSLRATRRREEGEAGVVGDETTHVNCVSVSSPHNARQA